MAKLAATPPVVGFSSTEMYGSPASRSRPSAAEVFAICMSDSTPSCMRAPPDAEQMIAVRRRASARSNTRVIFSPTTEPIEPPMNSKTKHADLDRLALDASRRAADGVGLPAAAPRGAQAVARSASSP